MGVGARGGGGLKRDDLVQGRMSTSSSAGAFYWQPQHTDAQLRPGVYLPLTVQSVQSRLMHL